MNLAFMKNHYLYVLNLHRLLFTVIYLSMAAASSQTKIKENHLPSKPVKNSPFLGLWVYVPV